MRPWTTKAFTKTYLNYLTEEWRLKRCVNLYHWFFVVITFSHVKKIVGSVVNLHYENTLFIFLFHLEGKLPIKTALKFQKYFPIVNKVTDLLPKLSTVEKLIIFNITNKGISLYKFDYFYWKEMLNTDLQSWIYFLAWYPVGGLWYF